MNTFSAADLSSSAKRRGFRRQDLRNGRATTGEPKQPCGAAGCHDPEEGTMILPSNQRAARRDPRRGETPMMPVSRRQSAAFPIRQGRERQICRGNIVSLNYGQRNQTPLPGLMLTIRIPFPQNAEADGKRIPAERIFRLRKVRILWREVSGNLIGGGKRFDTLSQSKAGLQPRVPASA